MSLRTRRTFLKLGALGSARTLLAARLRTPTSDPRRDRLAVASWPFHRQIIAPQNDMRDPNLPGFDLLGFAEFVRREFDITGIEPLDQHFPSTETAYMHHLRTELDRLGMRVRNIPIDASVDLGSHDAAVRDRGYALYRQWIEHAVILGSPSVRIAVPRCAGPTDIAGPAKALTPVADFAAAHNIMVHLENDDPVLASADRIVAILRAANNPNLRALPDFGNGLMAGDSAFAVHAAQLMFQFPGRIAHVKDFERVQGERHTVPLPQLLTIARRAGFTGTYSMESDSATDPAADTKHLIQQSLALL